MARARSTSFDPYAILEALERERVTYILIGSFARVVRGAEHQPVHLGGRVAVPIRRVGRAEHQVHDHGMGAQVSDARDEVLPGRAVQRSRHARLDPNARRRTVPAGRRAPSEVGRERLTPRTGA